MKMRRREFIAGLGSAAAWPLAAWAQQPAVPVIAFISGGSPDNSMRLLTAFRAGLGELSKAGTYRSSTTGWRVKPMASHR